MRFGYVAHAVLRWSMLGWWWLSYLGDEQPIAVAEAKWGRPVADLAQQWALVTYYVLDLAVEGQRLFDVVP